MISIISWENCATHVSSLTFSLLPSKGPFLHWLKRESLAPRPGQVGQLLNARRYVSLGEENHSISITISTHIFNYESLYMQCFHMAVLWGQESRPSPSCFSRISYLSNARYERGLRALTEPLESRLNLYVLGKPYKALHGLNPGTKKDAGTAICPSKL